MFCLSISSPDVLRKKSRSKLLQKRRKVERSQDLIEEIPGRLELDRKKIKAHKSDVSDELKVKKTESRKSTKPQKCSQSLQPR